jgi:hypothetical protein
MNLTSAFREAEFLQPVREIIKNIIFNVGSGSLHHTYRG